jgi:tetratricopeptide (TPR) repeat protein
VATIAHTTGCRGGCKARGLAGVALTASLLAFTGCEGFLAQARNSEGVQLYQQARYQEAQREFQEAIYAEPTNADAYYNLAATYHRIGRLEHRQADLDQAETNYNLCLDRNANHTDCYRGLAVLLTEQGRNDEAFRLIEGWVQRQPNVADAKIELARLNDEFGHRDVAKEHLIEALAIQPDNPRALTALGKIREDSGESAQALANYQRSLWYDDRQPQVASRVSALQSGMGTPASASPGAAATRLADRDSATQLR